MNKYTILILAVLVLPFDHAPAEVPDCGPCEEPNPDPYERRQGGRPCVPKPDGPIPGEPCKECKDGRVVEKPLICWELEKRGEDKSYGCNCKEGNAVDVLPTCSPRINTFEYFRVKESCHGYATYFERDVIAHVERVCKTSYDWENLRAAPVAECLAGCVAAALMRDPDGAAQCLACLKETFEEFDLCDYLLCEPDAGSRPLVINRKSHIGGLICE